MGLIICVKRIHIGIGHAGIENIHEILRQACL